MNKIKNFFIAIGLWFKNAGIAIGKWFASWFVSVNDKRPKFVSIGLWFKAVGIDIGKWFASWFVSIDGNRAKFVSIGRWFASWFVSIDGKRPKFVSIGLWFKNWFVPVDGKEAYFVRFGKWCKNIFVKDETGTRALTKLANKDGTKSFFSSIICIVIGLLVGIIVIVSINAEHSGDAISDILSGGINPKRVARSIAAIIVDFTPLLLCGLSIVFAYKCGLFNIGAAGQYVAGILLVYISSIGWGLPWYLCMLFAFMGGAILAALSGLLKAYLSVNEVISGIMFNWIILYLTNGILNGEKYLDPLKAQCYSIFAQSPTSILPKLGLDSLFDYNYMTIAPIIAILLAIFIAILLKKTTFGYEIRATGMNKNAAKYSGMNQNRNIIVTMFIAGGLAGLAAALYFLTGIENYNPIGTTSLPSMGFDGIAVGFLGALSPIGTIFSSFFITYIARGGGTLDTTYYSSEISDLISSVIIYTCAFALIFKNVITKFLQSKSKHKDNANKEETSNSHEQSNVTVEKGGDE